MSYDIQTEAQQKGVLRQTGLYHGRQVVWAVLPLSPGPSRLRELSGAGAGSWMVKGDGEGFPKARKRFDGEGCPFPLWGMEQLLHGLALKETQQLYIYI